jgi:uncharacterized protein YegP (UPF0339 family)
MLCKFFKRKPRPEPTFSRWIPALYRVELRRGDSGRWYWRVMYVSNGQVALTSETYESGFGEAEHYARQFANDNGLALETFQ